LSCFLYRGKEIGEWNFPYFKLKVHQSPPEVQQTNPSLSSKTSLKIKTQTLSTKTFCSKVVHQDNAIMVARKKYKKNLRAIDKEKNQF
jgi:hypothetical protein